ncbi:SpoIIE family protein phosphatase [Streptomyces guryensis]|uniref:SpoIIE family protein phosphatase n=1 Tax=Streptomyces guryensis TaxID=2886947 RepID=A0A9Q3VS90_9ACTN|nr:SpoIIE family protein phosphatase [Streptomyces guryensis]MCD9876260.1 SpoIIE family protein phosphatase [Streptomyces guryensis]
MFRGTRRGLVALTALAGTLLAVLVGVGFGVLFWSTSDMRQANLAERHAVAAQDQARLVDLLVIDEETYQRGYVIARQPEFLGPWKIVQGHFSAQAQKLVNISTSPAQRKRAQGIMRAGEAYIRDYSIPVVRLAQRGDPRATSPSVTLDGKHRVDAIRGLFDTYTTTESATVAAREATTDADAQHAAVAGAVGVGASVLLIAAYSGYVTRVIVLPVRRAARLAGRLAEGDLTARMPLTGAREIGQLETSFNSMAGSLQHSIGQAQEAHRRLRLLYDASMAVGTTLDVARTARELVGVAVPRFADFATVDLAVSVLQGGEPASAGATRLRRVARDGVRDDVPLDPVGVVIRPALPVPAGPGTGSGALFVHDLRASTGWQDRSPEEAGRLLDYGMNSLIIAPLVEQGVLMGIVSFWRGHASQPFEKEDVADAEELALKAAVAIDNARRYTRERETALTLQRSLLPQRLPEQPAVEVAYRYLPASTRAGVGGDWLDVIPLSGARVALVVGDVVGHGIHASATMGRLRTAVRTLADVDLPPDELLTQLDDLVMHLPGAGEETEAGVPGGAGAVEPGVSAGQSGAGVGEPGGMAGRLDAAAEELGATCLYAVYDPISRRCTLADAGHPLPFVIAPDGTVTAVTGHTGPPLGVGGLPFETTELELVPGSTLALYSDGLVHSRYLDVDQGQDRLRAALASAAGSADSLDDACGAVVDSLLTGPPADDVALLLARTRAFSTEQVVTWDIPADPEQVARARTLTTRQLEAWQLEEASFVTELVVSELVTNAIRYGTPPIQLRLIRTMSISGSAAGALVCEVSDGSNTAPHMRRARVFDEGGRGLLLVAQLTQRWGTRHGTTGKTIWCEQMLPTPGGLGRWE